MAVPPLGLERPFSIPIHSKHLSPIQTRGCTRNAPWWQDIAAPVGAVFFPPLVLACVDRHTHSPIYETRGCTQDVPWRPQADIVEPVSVVHASWGLCPCHSLSTNKPKLYRKLLLRGTILNTRYQVGPMVYLKIYIFNHFYSQYLVLLTMVPRNSLFLEQYYALSDDKHNPIKNMFILETFFTVTYVWLQENTVEQVWYDNTSPWTKLSKCVRRQVKQRQNVRGQGFMAGCPTLRPITADHSKWNQILLVKIAICIVSLCIP